MEVEEKVGFLVEGLLQSPIKSFDDFEFLTNKNLYRNTFKGTSVLFYPGGEYHGDDQEIEVILNALSLEKHLKYNCFTDNPKWSGLYCTVENFDGVDMYNVISIERQEYEMNINLNLNIELDRYPLIQCVLDDKSDEMLLKKRLLLSITKVENEYRIFSYKDKPIKSLSQPLSFNKDWIDSFQLFVQPLRLVYPRDDYGKIKVVHSEIHGYHIIFLNRNGDLNSVPLMSFDKAELRKLELRYTIETTHDSIKVPEEVFSGSIAKKGKYYYSLESFSRRIHGSNNWESEQTIYAEYDFKNMETVVIKCDYNKRKL